MNESLTRNVRRYLPFQVTFSFLTWTPIFFLYFNSLLPLREVLQLEAIYYATVVAFEVPSGYFSDRFGRVLTLRASAALLVAAYVTFALAGGFWTLAFAQVLLALSFAWKSGTDTSFHFDTLEALERTEEYGEREASVTKWLRLAGAFSAIVGGLVAILSLRAPYAVAAGAAVLCFAITCTFREPPRYEDDDDANLRLVRFPFLRSLKSYLQIPVVGWVFALFVVSIVINHIPYEFYQPIIGDLSQPLTVAGESLGTWTPLLAGAHLAVTQLISAPFGASSARLARRFGHRRYLLSSVALQAVIILAAALWAHPLVLVLLVARSIPSAMQQAPIRALVTPRVRKRHRATFLSIMSLAGRLAFSGVLIGLSAIEDFSFAGLEGIYLCLLVGGGIALASLLILVLTAPADDRAEPLGS